MHRWNCSLMLQVKMDGELNGQDDGSLTIGLLYKVKRVLPGRSSMLLPLLLTHGYSLAAWKNHNTLWQSNCSECVGERTCKSPEIMVLVCMLKFCAARNNFNVCVQHIPGVTNNIADALSHFQPHHFRKLAPNANPLPDIIPAGPHQTFIATSCSADIMVWPSQLVEHTNQVWIPIYCFARVLTLLPHLLHL